MATAARATRSGFAATWEALRSAIVGAVNEYNAVCGEPVYALPAGIPGGPLEVQCVEDCENRVEVAFDPSKGCIVCRFGSHAKGTLGCLRFAIDPVDGSLRFRRERIGPMEAIDLILMPLACAGSASS